MGPGGANDKKKEEGPLLKIVRDSSKMATEQIKGLSSQVGYIYHTIYGANGRGGVSRKEMRQARGKSEVCADLELKSCSSCAVRSKHRARTVTHPDWRSE